MKTTHLRRDPRVALCVLSDGFFGDWIQIDGTAEVVSLPEAMEPLVDYYRTTSGEHPDWDDATCFSEEVMKVARHSHGGWRRMRIPGANFRARCRCCQRRWPSAAMLAPSASGVPAPASVTVTLDVRPPRTMSADRFSRPGRAGVRRALPAPGTVIQHGSRRRGEQREPTPRASAREHASPRRAERDLPMAGGHPRRVGSAPSASSSPAPAGPVSSARSRGGGVHEPPRAVLDEVEAGAMCQAARRPGLTAADSSTTARPSAGSRSPRRPNR